MSGFGYHYPARAEHDPRAPWNQPGECEKCDGKGRVPASPSDLELGDAGTWHICPDCDGLGREKTRAELRAEWEEDKADMEREEA